LLETVGKQETSVPVLMDRAYADFKTRFTAWSLCFKAVFTRYDKLDAIYASFVLFAAIIILLRCVNTP
jgi:hypothetical protein